MRKHETLYGMHYIIHHIHVWWQHKTLYYIITLCYAIIYTYENIMKFLILYIIHYIIQHIHMWEHHKTMLYIILYIIYMYENIMKLYITHYIIRHIHAWEQHETVLKRRKERFLRSWVCEVLAGFRQKPSIHRATISVLSS